MAYISHNELYSFSLTRYKKKHSYCGQQLFQSKNSMYLKIHQIKTSPMYRGLAQYKIGPHLKCSNIRQNFKSEKTSFNITTIFTQK